MRFKAVPPPPETLDGLEAAWKAIPLVPEGEAGCCQRLASRIERVDLDEARQWVAMMRALDIVERTETGYVRVRPLPEATVLGTRFRENVFGVDEIISHLAESGPASPEDCFEAIEEVIPQWERNRNPGTWRTVWARRVQYVLDWGVLFGNFAQDQAGYRPARTL